MNGLEMMFDDPTSKLCLKGNYGVQLCYVEFLKFIVGSDYLKPVSHLHFYRHVFIDKHKQSKKYC